MAVKYVLKESFGAVIFNMQPDDLNGVQIFSVIKSIDYKLPIIVVTDNNVALYSVSSIISESFKSFKKPIGYNEVVEAAESK